jgi:hypothetical protein
MGRRNRGAKARGQRVEIEEEAIEFQAENFKVPSVASDHNSCDFHPLLLLLLLPLPMMMMISHTEMKIYFYNDRE